MKLPLPLLLSLFSLNIVAAPLSIDEQQKLITELRALHSRQPAMRADFTEEKTSRLLKKPIISSGSIAFEAPNKFRREVRGSSPSLTVNDGQKMTIYYPNFKQAEVYTLGERKFFDDSLAALTAGFDFSEIEQHYEVAATSEGDHYRLALTPKRASFKRILRQLHVEMDHDFRVLSTQILFPNGDRLSSRYRNQRREPLPAGTFSFTPPEGTEVTTPLGQ